MFWKLRNSLQIGRMALRGLLSARSWTTSNQPRPVERESNPLRAYFEAHRTGPGIWKWNHYFDVYHRHFQRFVGREVHVLEVGIYSGGSLGMWRDYFGPQCRIYGVDIQEECRAYESDGVRVFIGDQQDRAFWRRFKREVPTVDIVIDDGGHLPEQQIVTLEELLPHLRPGGVYLCEDVHGTFNAFGPYVHGLALEMNSMNGSASEHTAERRIVSRATPFQADIDGIHIYPFAVVLEKRDRPEAEFVAPKRGTQWQPFLDQQPSTALGR